MNKNDNSNDDVLGRLLESVCEELKAGKELDSEEWKRHPEFAEEWPHLLDALTQLHSAAVEWRGENHPNSNNEIPTLAGATPVPHRATPGPPPWQIGRYHILGSIGAGGMGTVYKAIDPELDRVVAIKVPRLAPESSEHSQAVERFVREARAAARVRHPHVCPIYDVGIHDGVPFVVMAFIEGQSLACKLREAGPYEDTATAIGVVRQIADAMAVVHENGIIHRDLKPGNILLDKQGAAFLTDFGLARFEISPSRLTGEGAILGTPPYMAPEQFHGDAGKIGTAADIYSLGVVLYELLVGKLPFTGDLLTLMNRPVDSVPPSASDANPRIPSAVAAVATRALATRPADRFASMTEFAEALGNSLSGMAPPPVRRHRSLSLWAKIACGFIFVAGLAAIVFYFWGPSLTWLVANRSSSGSPKQLIGKDAASTLLAQALAEGRYSRFTEVVRLTTEAMQADPDNAAIHEVRGRAYNELGQYDKAILDFTDALSKDPTFVLAYVSRSQAHLSLRHYQESIDDANAGLKLNPVELRARVSLCANRGWSLACMGKYDDALLDYEQVVKLDSRNALGYWQRAVIFDHANRPTEAQQDRTKAIDLDPSLKNSPPPKLE